MQKLASLVVLVVLVAFVSVASAQTPIPPKPTKEATVRITVVNDNNVALFPEKYPFQLAVLFAKDNTQWYPVNAAFNRCGSGDVKRDPEERQPVFRDNSPVKALLLEFERHAGRAFDMRADGQTNCMFPNGVVEFTSTIFGRPLSRNAEYHVEVLTPEYVTKYVNAVDYRMTSPEFGFEAREGTAKDVLDLGTIVVRRIPQISYERRLVTNDKATGRHVVFPVDINVPMSTPANSNGQVPLAFRFRVNAMGPTGPTFRNFEYVTSTWPGSIMHWEPELRDTSALLDGYTVGIDIELATPESWRTYGSVYAALPKFRRDETLR